MTCFGQGNISQHDIAISEQQGSEIAWRGSASYTSAVSATRLHVAGGECTGGLGFRTRGCKKPTQSLPPAWGRAIANPLLSYSVMEK